MVEMLIFDSKFNILKFLILILNFVEITFSHYECNLNTRDYYNPLILNTNYGKILGSCSKVVIVEHQKENQTRTENIISWLSVPYAEPPINENRFKRPKELKPWNHLRDGRSLPNYCMQKRADIKNNISEDCLYLNIYAPASLYEQNKTTNELLPIFVYIHGGHFEKGSSSLDVFVSHVLSGVSKMIVVTLNYRLGIFGFLYLDKSEIIGNQGFMDQYMAIKWIYENAIHFNGDQNRITIGGQSAGSMSISYHLIHPPSWPYFRNAIMQSGSFFYSIIKFLPLNEANRRAEGIFSLLGCNNKTNLSDFNLKTSVDEMLECVQNIDSIKVLEASYDYYVNELLNGNQFASELAPLVGLVQNGIDFKENIEKVFEKGNFKKINLLIGHNRDEGSFLVKDRVDWNAEVAKYPFLNKTAFQEFLKKYYYYFPNYPEKSSLKDINAIIDEYIKDVDETNTTNYLNSLIQILGEEAMICPCLDFSRVYAKQNNVYLYSFNHFKSFNTWHPIFGVDHTDEVPFVFGEPLKDHKAMNYTDDERKLSKQMIKYWSNFVKYNDPNINDKNDSDYNPFWSPFKIDNTLQFGMDSATNVNLFARKRRDSLNESYFNNYMLLEADNMTSNEFSYPHCEFWRNYNIYPNKSLSKYKTIGAYHLAIILLIFSLSFF